MRQEWYAPGSSPAADTTYGALVQRAASAALTAPTAMTVAGRLGIAPFLMGIMVANGSSAASLIPIAPTGIIVNNLMTKMGMGGLQWLSFFIVFVAHTSVGFLGYFLFGQSLNPVWMSKEEVTSNNVRRDDLR